MVREHTVYCFITLNCVKVYFVVSHVVSPGDVQGVFEDNVYPVAIG